jgi:hypothetical protein
VDLGEPLFIVENLGITYPPSYREPEGASDGSTPISPGQLEVLVTVQAAFAIE